MQPEGVPIRPVVDRHAETCRVVSVTLCVRERLPLLANAVFARHCIDFLRALATLTGTRLYAYCLMPDHVHLLIGPSPATSVPGFVGRWKSLCAREWHRRTGQTTLWQGNYFDRALSEDEDLLRTGHHILMNPVRAGLVETPEDYPLGGSLEWDLSTGWGTSEGTEETRCAEKPTKLCNESQPSRHRDV